MYNPFSYCCNYYAVSSCNNKSKMIITGILVNLSSSLGCFILICTFDTKEMVN